MHLQLLYTGIRVLVYLYLVLSYTQWTSNATDINIFLWMKLVKCDLHQATWSCKLLLIYYIQATYLSLEIILQKALENGL